MSQTVCRQNNQLAERFFFMCFETILTAIAPLTKHKAATAFKRGAKCEQVAS